MTPKFFLPLQLETAIVNAMQASLLVVALSGLVATTSHAAPKTDRADSPQVVRKAEDEAARKWILSLPKQVQKWLTAVQHKPEPGEPWGLFTFSADSKIPYCIVSTAIAWAALSPREGIEKMPGYHPKAKEELAAWVQRFQDPKTHQFIDPLHESCVPNIDDPAVRYSFREAVTKYAVVLLKRCDAEPLYPYTPGANEEGKFDPEHYLKFIKNGDWDKHAW